MTYFNTLQSLFKSDDFKATHDDPKARREMIGNAIYEAVEKVVGAEAAPKVTGMIIDLGDIELIPAVSTIENLRVKARDANNLLQQMKSQQEIRSGVPAAAPFK